MTDRLGLHTMVIAVHKESHIDPAYGVVRKVVEDDSGITYFVSFHPNMDWCQYKRNELIKAQFTSTE